MRPTNAYETMTSLLEPRHHAVEFEGEPLKRHELIFKDEGVYQAMLPLLNRRR